MLGFGHIAPRPWGKPTSSAGMTPHSSSGMKNSSLCRFDKVVILCPEQVTGGPEALH